MTYHVHIFIFQVTKPVVNITRIIAERAATTAISTVSVETSLAVSVETSLAFSVDVARTCAVTKATSSRVQIIDTASLQQKSAINMLFLLYKKDTLKHSQKPIFADYSIEGEQNFWYLIN